MKYSIISKSTLTAMTCTAVLASSLLFSTPARERRDEHRPAHHESVRQAPPQQAHHYAYHRGRFFTVSAVGRMAIAAPFGQIVLGLPLGYRTIVYGKNNYFYYDGIFYRRHDNGYIIVEAPRVRYVPYGARRVMVNSDVYFVKGDTWYCSRGDEFEVCGQPASEVNVPVEAVKTTIMIGNSNGSRTPVELEPMGANQWRGPRGEIYDGLPGDEQLRQAYGF